MRTSGRSELRATTGSAARKSGAGGPGGAGVADELSAALDLLRRLNRLRLEDGRRVAALVRVDGFETWWFVQESVFWNVLVPYVREPGPVRRQIEESLARGRTGAGGPLDGIIAGPSRRRGSDALRVLIRRVGRAPLAAASVFALVLFRLLKRDTLLYTLDKITPGLDHDFRITAVYRELRARGYRFAEYVHVHRTRAAAINGWRRGRPVVWMEPLTELFAPRANRPEGPRAPIRRDTDDEDGDFLALLAEAALHQARRSAARYLAFKRLLRFQRVHRAVILDDSRHANELVAACRQLGVPTLGYMHGLLNRYHPGLMAFGFDRARRHTFDLYGLWSEYFRARLFEGDLYDHEGTFVCGPLRPPPQSVLDRPRDTRKDGPIRVLFVSEPRAPLDELIGYLTTLLRDSGVEVAMKTRPGEVVPPGIETPASGGQRMHVIPATTSLHEAILASDVVLGTYSTVLYEAALMLRPAVVMDTSFRYGHDIVVDGLADVALSPEEIGAAVRRAHGTDEAEVLRRRNAIWGRGEVSDGARVLLDVAEEQLWTKPGDE